MLVNNISFKRYVFELTYLFARNISFEKDESGKYLDETAQKHWDEFSEKYPNDDIVTLSKLCQETPENLLIEHNLYERKMSKNFFVQEIKDLQDTVETLREQKFARFSNEECWIYQEDGDNKLDTLVCPVVISPRTLQKLINQAKGD